MSHGDAKARLRRIHGILEFVESQAPVMLFWRRGNAPRIRWFGVYAGCREIDAKTASITDYALGTRGAKGSTQLQERRVLKSVAGHKQNQSRWVIHTGGLTMKLGKSLLLGSAAALAATVGAQAADLPMRKSAPVDYVRVCDWTGAGYFYIPGSDTCMNIGGLVRAEYAFINNVAGFLPDGRRRQQDSPERRRRQRSSRVACVTDRLLRSWPYRRRHPHADRLRHAARLRPSTRSIVYRASTPAVAPLVAEHLRQPGATGLPRQGLHPVRWVHGRSRSVVLRLLRR